ncbi:MAG TPA: SHOCT domain-containing protein [Rhizobacter sp.]|nr:SHOCT domain-containing protein [Rhizobacter sp.]
MNTLHEPLDLCLALRRLLCGALLAGGLGGGAAQAAGADTPAGPARPPAASSKAEAGGRSWQIHEFTRVDLVAREAGATPNQHPAGLAPEALRDLLAGVGFTSSRGRVPLFAGDELAELAGPLSQALKSAGPGDDVLLLSSARREYGLLGAPTAVTARLFVQDGQLQLIVHDARLDFYDTYRGTYAAPHFVFGSRSLAGSVSLQAPGATPQRADWLALAAPAAAVPAVPGAAPAPSRASPEPATGQDAERRLETLKRLRDKNLISEDEYQQKRKEILQLL